MKILYIDSQNIHLWIKNNYNWKIDWKKFYIFCKEKYKIDELKIFLWYVEKYKNFYKYLEKIWYKIVFKKTNTLPNWTIKWNVDVDITMIAMQDFCHKNIKEFFIMTWDWDFNTLVEFFIEKNMFWIIFFPWVSNSSKLLKKLTKSKNIDLIKLKNKIQKIKPEKLALI